MSDPSIIYENADFLAVNKPAGLMVHAVRLSSKRPRAEIRAQEPTLVDWLLPRYPEIKMVGDDPAMRAGIVHRLDKETSGVLLVPRTQKYFEYLKSLFKNHEVEKTYLAVVHGMPVPADGVIDAPIGIKSGTLKRSVHSEKMAKPAVTAYGMVAVKKENGETKSLLEVRPRTGRTHQIRVHLASIGNPIVGDSLYGSKKEPSRLMLHAWKIAFSGPAGERFELEADLPLEFKNFSLSTGDKRG